MKYFGANSHNAYKQYSNALAKKKLKWVNMQVREREKEEEESRRGRGRTRVTGNTRGAA